MSKRKKGSETILVVDDDSAVLNLIKRILSPLGYRLLLAKNSEEALLIAKNETYFIHLLLTDVILPGMNGLGLAEYFLAAYPRTKILFMSGYMCPSLGHQDIPYSQNPFVRKPFTPETLITKLRKVLQSDYVYDRQFCRPEGEERCWSDKNR